MEASDGPGDMRFPCELVSFEHNLGLSICRLEAYRGFARSTHHAVKLTHDYTQQTKRHSQKSVIGFAVNQGDLPKVSGQVQ